jgi:hypothetical protein
MTRPDYMGPIQTICAALVIVLVAIVWGAMA